MDIPTMYAVKSHSLVISIYMDDLPHQPRPQRRHPHHAFDDAIEQAELFANLMTWTGSPS